jgi:hypothetical protein
VDLALHVLHAGYVVEHRKAGTPHWIRATTDLVLQPQLELSGLEPGWRYQFRVTAENAADLLSDPGEMSLPLTVARAYRPATMAPQFSVELRDTVALENEKVRSDPRECGCGSVTYEWLLQFGNNYRNTL